MPKVNDLLKPNPNERIVENWLSPQLKEAKQIKGEGLDLLKQYKNKPKRAKFDKAVQVYDDLLKQKYHRKRQFANKGLQTDDILIDEIALEQHEFRYQ